ncbi:hypothetical protein SCALM49S_06604 [Streptomyces californicus]
MGFDLTAQVSAAAALGSAARGGAAPTSIGTASAAARARPSSRGARPMVRMSFLPGSAATARKVRPDPPCVVTLPNRRMVQTFGQEVWHENLSLGR